MLILGVEREVETLEQVIEAIYDVLDLVGNFQQVTKWNEATIALEYNGGVSLYDVNGKLVMGQNEGSTYLENAKAFLEFAIEVRRDWDAFGNYLETAPIDELVGRLSTHYNDLSITNNVVYVNGKRYGDSGHPFRVNLFQACKELLYFDVARACKC